MLVVVVLEERGRVVNHLHQQGNIFWEAGEVGSCRYSLVTRPVWENVSFCFQVCASLKLGGVGGELEVECLRLRHLPLLLPVSAVSLG